MRQTAGARDMGLAVAHTQVEVEGREVGGGGRYVGGGGRYVGGGGRYSGGWNRGGRVGIYLGAPIGFGYGYNPYSYYGVPYYGTPYYGVPYSPTYYPLVQPAPVTYIERSDEQQVETQAQAAPNDSSQNAQEIMVVLLR